MKFGCFSLDFRRFSLERAFASAQRYGFDGLELWGGRPHAYPFDIDAKFIARLVQLKKGYGVDIPMYTPNAIGMPVGLCSLDARERADAVAYFKTAVDACADMEIPRMLMVADHPGYETPRRKSWQRFTENMQEIGEHAASKCVKLVIEPLTPMESPIITTADDCVDAIADIGLENIEAMMDIVPPNIAYEPMSAYFEKLQGRMNYIHLCNNDGKTDAHTRLEQGEIPIEDVLRLFKEYEFQGYVTLELYTENYKDPELMMANSARVLEKIRRVLNI